VGDLAGAGFQAVVRVCFNTLVAFNLLRFNLFLPLFDLVVDFEALLLNVFFFPLFFFFFVPRCPRVDVASFASFAFTCAARAAAKAACSAAASARAS
jgi:hypothetical protein